MPLQINVFKLGRTYKALLDELRLGGNVFLMNPIDPESLIYRFAKQLEFGTSTMSVAGEAVRIIQRMNRDWMTTGRRPAGLCGAALILAARMNNFRRTIREVVYVVKVTEITISQRLNEFSSTESGELTVDQFRSVQLENAHDPPSFTRAREGRKPSHQKRKQPDNAAEIEDDAISLAESEAESVQPRRVDADGFAIPNLPIDPALVDSYPRRPSITKAVNEVIEETKQEAIDSKDSKGKGKRPSYPAPSAEQVASEDALESEMRTMLAKGSKMIEGFDAPSKPPVSDSAEIDASEFEDDPEVSHCLLSPAEVDIKERIWVHENKEYLRTQQAKALKRALAEATSGPTKPRKRRKGRLGDVTYLEGDGDGEDGRSSRASTPAEATRRMLERRGYSKKINYSLLDTLYGQEGAEDDEKAKAESQNGSRSRSHSVASRRSRSASVQSQRPSRRERRASRATPAPSATPTKSLAKPFQPPTAQQPTPPATAPQAPNNNPKPAEEDPVDPDDMDEDDDDDIEDDHVDEAFAGTYEDDYYDAGSDDDGY